MSLTGQRIWGGEMELGAGGSSGGRGGSQVEKKGGYFWQRDRQRLWGGRVCAALEKVASPWRVAL